MTEGEMKILPTNLKRKPNKKIMRCVNYNKLDRTSVLVYQNALFPYLLISKLTTTITK